MPSAIKLNVIMMSICLQRAVILIAIMPNVIILSVVVLNVIILNVIMMSAGIQSIVILSVIMPSAIILSVVMMSICRVRVKQCIRSPLTPTYFPLIFRLVCYQQAGRGWVRQRKQKVCWR